MTTFEASQVMRYLTGADLERPGGFEPTISTVATSRDAGLRHDRMAQAAGLEPAIIRLTVGGRQPTSVA